MASIQLTNIVKMQRLILVGVLWCRMILVDANRELTLRDQSLVPRERIGRVNQGGTFGVTRRSD